MLHLIRPLQRAPGIPRDAFLDHWLNRHARRVASMRQVRRYVLDEVEQAADGEPWDGVEEIWVDDLATLRALAASLAQSDERAFLDTAASPWFATEDHCVFAGAPMARGAAHPKRMTFFHRKPRTTHDELLRYWRGTHGPLAAQAPGLRRYVQSEVLRRPGEAEPPFDGIAQIWIEDTAALANLLASPIFRERIKPDEANFVDTTRNVTLAVRERREVWPEAGA